MCPKVSKSVRYERELAIYSYLFDAHMYVHSEKYLFMHFLHTLSKLIPKMKLPTEKYFSNYKQKKFFSFAKIIFF